MAKYLDLSKANLTMQGRCGQAIKKGDLVTAREDTLLVKAKKFDSYWALALEDGKKGDVIKVCISGRLVNAPKHGRVKVNMP